MTIIYDVIAKRHKGNSRPDVCLFYDEDREKAINYMSEYNKKHGFTIAEKEGTFTIATLVLRERESTGKKIKESKYHEIFNTCSGRRLN